jgi:Na+-driven multidrug efflux pump
VEFLGVISWNFFAIGIVFACSGMFQALGNTLPGLASSATRLASFALPALWLSRHADFRLVDVWHISVASVLLQACLSLLLVRWQLVTRLKGLVAAPAATTAADGQPA